MKITTLKPKLKETGNKLFYPKFQWSLEKNKMKNYLNSVPNYTDGEMLNGKKEESERSNFYKTNKTKE
jgi:hypothetical protein